jgi:hypothetical protein
MALHPRKWCSPHGIFTLHLSCLDLHTGILTKLGNATNDEKDVEFSGEKKNRIYIKAVLILNTR